MDLEAVSLPMPRRHLSGLLIVATLVISKASLSAQRQQHDVAKLKEDARNTVGIIGGDKAKSRRYCQIVDLTGELDQAIEKKNKKKTKALTEKAVQLQKQLPEYVTLSNILEQVDLKSPDGREIALIIQSLIQSCPE
jgi:Spy/CpxP family protein refolding chaperone